MGTTLTYARYLVGHSPILADIENKDLFADVLAEQIETVYLPAWLAHPDYWPSESDPHNPTVIAVFAHEPYEGHDESYVIARLGDVLSPANIRWGLRTLGVFKCVRAISPDIPVSRTRIGYISWSLKGKGNGFACRERLKKLLPRKYRPLITMARQIATTPKWAYLKTWMHAHPETNLQDRTSLPAWYKAVTRDALNFSKFAERARQRQGKLTNYITLENLWRATTGQVHPNDVSGLITHQASLFDV